MSRPSFVVCDSDALIQFFLAQELRPLRVLRSRYSIQPVLVPEVKIELESNRKFGTRISGELRKALSNGLLKSLDKTTLEPHYGGGAAGIAGAGAAMAQIQKVGRQYQSHVGYGEAYTHSAALALAVPALSNDKNALDVLLNLGLPVPNTVLRTFDLLALCHQAGEMSESECNDFRSFLVKEREHIPASFTNESFGDGLRKFRVRITDCVLRPVGASGGEILPFARVIDL